MLLFGMLLHLFSVAFYYSSYETLLAVVDFGMFCYHDFEDRLHTNEMMMTWGKISKHRVNNVFVGLLCCQCFPFYF